MTTPDDLCVFKSENVPELHFLLGVLRNEGIDAIEWNASASSFVLSPLWNAFPSIVVRDPEQLERARAIVADYKRRRADPDPPAV